MEVLAIVEARVGGMQRSKTLCSFSTLQTLISKSCAFLTSSEARASLLWRDIGHKNMQGEPRVTTHRVLSLIGLPSDAPPLDLEFSLFPGSSSDSSVIR